MAFNFRAYLLDYEILCYLDVLSESMRSENAYGPGLVGGRFEWKTVA